MKSQKLLFAVIATLAIAIGFYAQTGLRKSSTELELNKIILLPQSKDIGALKFRDHKGNAFTKDRLLGKWSIVFFGFTNCPDICPTTLQTLAEVKQSLQATPIDNGNAWAPYQVIMVSVDPERDKLEKLNSYVPWFDEEFIGLAGDLEYTQEFAKKLGIIFYKSQQQSDTVYEVDHSASLILLNPQGKYAGAITAPHKIDEISSDLLALSKNLANSDQKQKSVDAVSVALDEPNLDLVKNNNLEFNGMWIRSAPPGVTSMAAYMSLTNTSDKDIIIKEIEAPDFAMAMIHDTVIEDGVASMDHLDTLVVKAGEEVALAPLQKHIMLMRPNRNLNKGSVSRLVLIDQQGTRYPILIEVRDRGSSKE